MKTISNDFRNALRGIRQINSIISYKTKDVSKVLTTELSQELQTELQSFLGTELGIVEINSDVINSVNPLFNTELFRTICKSIEIDSKEPIPLNTWVNLKVGVLVNTSYEYIDFGDYYITESKYEASTNSYIMTAYDRMIEAMVPYDLTITYPITIKNLLIAIFNKLNWEYDINTFVNYDKTLSKDLFSNQDLTYRDVLDNICGVIVGNIMFTNKVAKIHYIQSINNTTLIPFTIPQTLNSGLLDENRYITEEDLKDVNVTIDKKYGPINSIIITSNDVVLDNLELIPEGQEKTQYNFKDNRILIYDSTTYITDMFNAIKGLEYYLYDFDTIGKLYFDPLDKVIVKLRGENYETIVFNSDIHLTTGLTETFYADEPEETTQEYIVNDKREKKINDALISIDKANAQIVLKVDSQGKIVQAELKADAEEGSLFTVKAANIKLEGYTTINGGFSIDEHGNALITSKDSATEIGEDAYVKVYSDYGYGNYKNETLINSVGVYQQYVEDFFGDITIHNKVVGVNNISVYAKNPSNDVEGWITLQPYASSNDGYGGNISFGKYGSSSYIGHTDDMGYINLMGNRIDAFAQGNDSQLTVQNADGSYQSYIKPSGMWARGYNSSSQESLKKNIELDDGCLEQILETDICSFNWKFEDDGDQKHIGCIIADEGGNYKIAPKVLTHDKDAIDLYSMAGMSWKAIQELYDIIKTQQNKINELEEIINGITKTN